MNSEMIRHHAGESRQRRPDLTHELSADFNRLKRDLIQCLFVFWLANLITTLAFMRIFITGRLGP